MHGVGVPIFLNELGVCLEGLSASNMFIIGDINIDILNTSICYECDNVMAEHGLVSLVHEPTRITRESSTCLDHVYCRNSPGWAGRAYAEVLHLEITDHSMTVLYVKDCACDDDEGMNIGNQSVPRVEIDFNMLNDLLRGESWADIYGTTDVSFAYVVILLVVSGQLL